MSFLSFWSKMHFTRLGREDHNDMVSMDNTDINIELIFYEQSTMI